MKLTFNEWLSYLTKSKKTCQPKEPYYNQVVNGENITFSFNPKYK